MDASSSARSETGWLTGFPVGEKSIGQDTGNYDCERRPRRFHSAIVTDAKIVTHSESYHRAWSQTGQIRTLRYPSA